MVNAVSLDFDRRPSALRYMLRGMRPVARRVTLEPRISARWRDHRVDARDLDAFLSVSGLPRRATLPLLYPHTFGFRLPMAILTHPSFPVPIWSVLQTRNHLVQHVPIPVDASCDFETRVADGRAVAKGAEFDLHTTVHVDGTLAWESTVTFLARGRFGEPGPAVPLARAPAETGPLVAEWRVRDDWHRRFGGFTGDYNGIHLWDWYARRFGFSRALYHPPRVLAECCARLPDYDDGGPLRLDAWLKGPVSHGATVQLHAIEGSDATTFALFAGEDRPSIVGRLSRRPSQPGAALRNSSSAA